MNKKNIIYIFTDGNCKANGKKTALAGYGVWATDDENNPLIKINNFSILKEKIPTNNKAELTAILKALDGVKLNVKSPIDVILCCDSMYSINCVTKWYKKWETNGWENSTGHSVKNSEIIKEILKIKDELKENNIPVSFKHIFSHKREPNKDSEEHFFWFGNMRVDKGINDVINERINERI